MKKTRIIVTLMFSSFCLAASAAESPIAVLGAILGKAQILRKQTQLPATKGMPVFATDTLITTERTVVKIQFQDGSNFMAFENSKVKIEEYSAKVSKGKIGEIKSILNIATGKLRFFIKPKELGAEPNKVTFKTANATMGIRGTSGFIDASSPDKTQLVVLSGNVEISNPKLPEQKISVSPGQMTDVMGANPPLPPKAASDSLLKSLGSEASKLETNTDEKAESSDKKEDKPKSEEKKSDDNKKTEDKPADKSEEKATDKPADKAEEKATDKPAEKLTDKPEETQTNKVLEQEKPKKTVIFTPEGDSVVVTGNQALQNVTAPIPVEVPKASSPEATSTNLGSGTSVSDSVSTATSATSSLAESIQKQVENVNATTTTAIQNTISAALPTSTSTATSSSKKVKVRVTPPTSTP